MFGIKKYDVITVGGATLDVFVKSKELQSVRGHEFRTGIGECIALGTKIEVDDLVIATGGGATNSATTFARLGLKIGCLARVGNDLFGQAIFSDLRLERVDTDLVVKAEGEPTAFSNLLVTASGERTALVFRGAGHHFKPDEIDWDTVSAKWLYVTSLAGHLEFLKQLLDHAERIGTQVAYNPGGAEITQGKKLLPHLERCTIVNMNREEASLLLGDLPPARLVRKLHEHAGMIALVTDGKNGAWCASGDNIFQVMTTGVEPVSTTGAGDAFGSGMLAGFLKYRHLTEALKIGMINAESVIGHLGAKAGLLRELPSESIMKKVKVRTV